MKYYLDTEFHEYKKDGVNTIELISIGIICEDGREYYAISKEFDLKAAHKNKWLSDNVLRPMFKELTKDSRNFSPFEMADIVPAVFAVYGRPNDLISQEIRDFIGDDQEVEFYAYYADYDWVVFCWLFGRMIDLPSNFPMYCKDLKQIMDEYVTNEWLPDSIKYMEGSDVDVTFDLALEKLKSLPDYPKQDNEHNALDDAKWNMELHKFLNDL